MTNTDETKEQLAEELAEARQRIAQLEALDSERTWAQQELRRTLRAFKVLSGCNQVIIRATEESKLLAEVCRVIVDVGGYRLAWVGFTEADKKKTVRPMAQQGYEQGYLTTANITWADNERGRGPTGTAIRTGKPVVVRDILTDPSYVPWRREAIRSGYASAIALPLGSGQPVFGALNIYATEPDAFDAEEVKLLTELAGDLTYSITALRTETQRQQAEAALRESEERYRTTLNSMLEGCQIIGFDWCYLYVNDSAAKHGRRTKNELLGHTMMEIYPGIENTEMFASLRRCMEKRIPHSLENLFTFPDGSQGWFELSIEPVPEGIFILSWDITERKQAEELSQTVIDSSPIGIYIVQDGKLKMVNSSLLRLTGYSEAEALGRKSLSFVLAKDRDMVQESAAKMLQGERSAPYEYRLVDKRGRVRWVMETVTSFQYQGRLAALGNYMDITEHKQAEEVLQQSEERYRRLFEMSPDGITILDMKGVVTATNPATLKIGGYAEDDLVGKHFTKLSAIRVRDIPKHIKTFTSIVRGKVPPPFETTYHRKDGSLGWTEIHLALLKAGSKKIGLQIIHRDITERRQMEEALRESEDKYRTIFESTGTAVAIIEEDTTISLVNREFEKVSGYTKKEVEGKKSWADFVAKEDLARMAEYHRLRRIDPDVVPRSYEARFIHKRGNIVNLLITIAMIPGTKKSLASLLDITESKRAEAERKELEAQLIQSQKMEAVGRLAGGVAHDFNNLLTVIIGFSELLLNRLGEHDPRRTDIAEIKKAGEQAATLTRQLLAFSRRQVIQPKAVNLNEVVTDMEKMLRRLIGEDVELVTILEPRLAGVKADPGQIEQVIMNLVVNARDAMPEGGRLVTRVENITLDKTFCEAVAEARPGKFVCLSVEDSGVGMSQEILEHIFEPFFSTKQSGTGLGLSVVYGIIKQHEGWISVDSQPGKGTVFQIYLPAISPGPAGESQEIDSLAEPGGSGQRILLVEDEPGVRAFASRVLSENGYTVFEAASAEEALTIFERENGEFHLVYCDVVLPGKTGLQLVDQFLAGKPGLPVLMSSGYTDEQSRGSVIQERGFAFLQKPCTLTELLRAVKETIGQT